MSLPLDGKVAIVTGAGRRQGIGAAIARECSAQGARVLLADLGDAATEGSAIAAELGTDRAAFQPCDVTDEASVAALVEAAIARFGQLDILVNNAAIFTSLGTDLDVLDLARWNQCLAVCLTGVFLCTRAAMPHLRASRGAIVNIASVDGMRGDAGLGAYNAAKGGVENMTRTLAIEGGPHGVRANAVCPGPILTGRPMLTRPDVQEDFLPRIPLRRYGVPEDIAKVAAFLASDGAAYVTGAIIPVDGGITCQTGQPDMRRFMNRDTYAPA